MDYAAALERLYEYIEEGHVDKAVMACLRIARHRKDYLHAAIFLREMYPDRRQLNAVLLDDIGHLKEEARQFVVKSSLDYWLSTRTLDFTLSDDDDEERNVLATGIGEVVPELKQWQESIEDMTVPSGMGEYDTAAFTDRFVREKAKIRLRIKALQTVEQRVRSRCLNYAIRIERELDAQRKSRSFLKETQTHVNNYFKAHSEDVYKKLQKAAQLVDSVDPEDWSLLLTEVRRAIKAAADFFYPARKEPVTCADGKQRQLGDDMYVNRLHEYLATTFRTSSSQDLLSAELDYLAAFAHRLYDVASKGVHSEVLAHEAKQGLVGLYMFLYNVTLRLQEDDSMDGE
ncbi:MAG: hypothetical protein JXQ75_13785 [Phycisphaerae bacterium]|nr:hypothetical protein [Phycisphaerae bacterium]